jgi:hypothetical protein
MRLAVTSSGDAAVRAPVSPPDEVTLSTCIGCGAMSLPAQCPEGCAQELRLELVPAAELDELTDLTESAESQAIALAAVVTPLAREPRRDDTPAPAAPTAAAALFAHGQLEPRLCELVAQPVEPVVSWWCPHCGGVDAPQPCLGVCIRTPVRWAGAERACEMQVRATRAINRVEELRAVLILAAHAHPRPGQEKRHRDAVRQRAQRALAHED